MFTQSNLNR